MLQRSFRQKQPKCDCLVVDTRLDLLHHTGDVRPVNALII